MALVTIQRSPSPSTDNDLDTVGSSEDAIDGRSSIKRRSKTSREKLKKIIQSVHFIAKLQPRLSDSYFTVKGAALILPNNEYSKKSSRKSHGGEIQGHLQAMLHLLRPEDKIKIAVRLEDTGSSRHSRYMALVSTLGRQDTEEAVILGIDCCKGEIANIRLVLPIWLGVQLRLGGDGGFSLCTDQEAYLFNPVSVQAMWSAIQSLVKVMRISEDKKYLQEGLTHTWLDYYRGQLNSDLNRNSHWSVEGVDIFAPSHLALGNDENEAVKHAISCSLREVMMNVDLDETTSKSLRTAVEGKMGISLNTFKNYFDEEMMRILGQMDAPSKILDFLYLGSEWNASNLDELKEIGIGYILNITQEIDNFFSGMFQYYNVRLYDVEESDLLRHWDKTYKFISKVRDNGSKVLVHCKMGISRSASSVMAYLMKHNRWGVDEAFDFVKKRRSCVRPNNGFMEQLHMYEAILCASNKRDIFRVKSDQNLLDDSSKEEDGDQCQGFLLGDSLFHVMSKSEWWIGGNPTLEQEEEWLRANVHTEPGMMQMETDLETVDTRSGDSVEEAHPDVPSPPPFQTGSGASSSSSTTPLEPLVDSDSLTNPNAGGPISLSDDARQTLMLDGDPSLNACGLQSRIKPDSSWIKIDSGELTNETDTDITMVSSESISTLEDTDNGQPLHQSLPVMFIQSALNTSHNYADPDRAGQEIGGGSNTGTNLELFPSTQSPPRLNNDSDNAGVQLREPGTQTCVSSSNHEAMITDDNQITISSLTTPQTFTDTFDQNQNPLEVLASNTLIPVQRSQSFSPTNEEMSTSDLSSSPSRGVEVGVREYFFREKIPWNPGKVQKIREGINRTGHIAGAGKEETCESDLSPADSGEEYMVVDVNNSEVNIPSKEDELSQQTDNDERSSLSQPGEASCNEANSRNEGASAAMAVSLYDMEEIPLEPGTVLRTRMEIEERQRSQGESGEDPESRPVSRTSSLKHTKDSSPPPSESSKRRVSCGPIMAQEQMNHPEEDMSLAAEVPKLDDVCMKEMPVLPTRGEGESDSQRHDDDVLKQELGGSAVSLQIFGDDLTIQAGLVKKHRMEIETKRDVRYKQTATNPLSPDDSEESYAHLSGRNSSPKAITIREITPDVFSVSAQEHSQTNLFSDISQPEDSMFTGSKMSQEKGNLDKHMFDSAFVMRPNSEPATATEMKSVGEAGGGRASDMVKLFVNKIENQTSHPNPQREIIIVESHSDRDKSSVFPIGVSELPQSDLSKSDARGVDLGFNPGESGTDAISLSCSPKLQDHSIGDGSESLAVRHLVGRFEKKSPADEDSSDTSASRELCSEVCGSSSSSTFQQQSSSSSETNQSVSSSPLKSTSLHHQTEQDQKNINLTAMADTHFPSAASKTPSWRKDTAITTTQAGRGGDYETQTLGMPILRSRPKSADHARDKRYHQESECSPICDRSSNEIASSSVDGKSESLSRQVSEESRKIRKLHGKSHPLTKLASSQSQWRGGPFHSSM